MTPPCGSWKGGNVVKMTFSTFLFLFLIPMESSTGKSSISHRKLEVQRLLKHLNRPAVKSIKSPDGDIIDCVHIQQQPAFDHHLLKNHTIQTAPTLYPGGHSFDGISSSLNARPIIQLWHLNGRCPEATIPIRRIKEEDILRGSFVKSYGAKKHLSVHQVNSTKPESNFNDSSNHEYSMGYMRGDKYHGATAKFNVWKPQVEQDEFSLAQMWIVGGDKADDTNTIEAGWQLYPRKYGDNVPRLFIYWTSDHYKSTGCYNLECSGFVQLSSEIALGGALSRISSFGGAQYEIDILIWKNPNDGNWWMQVGQKHVLGYWPAALFNHLADSASMIQWGGEIVNIAASGQHTTTQMGSGHFPEEGPGKVGFIRNLRVVDASNVLWPPKDLETFVDKPDCYEIQTDKSTAWGTYFYYGGPGRNPKCP